MDIARPDQSRRKRIRRALYGAIAVLAVGAITLGVSRLKPAAPGVDRGTVLVDSVRRGDMVVDVRGQGTLVPEDIRWIPATTEGRVERIHLRPGTPVTAASVILDLSNPQLEQELRDAELKLNGAEASLANLRVQSQNDALAQEAATAGIEAEYKKAAMQVEANEQLSTKGLVPDITLKQSKLDADQLAARFAIAKKQLASYAESTRARLDVQQSEVEQARAAVRLKHRQVDDLHVHAGFAGVLQVVPVDVGQQVAPGANLARVADPSHLKAELKIPETQAKDIQPGQRASIDTRNGVVAGTVVRIDPSVQNGTVTVDVTMTEAMPKGARPDLSVDGTIELQHLRDVLYVGRPAFGQEQSAAGLFKVHPDGTATRVQVKLGATSVNAVEIRSGLSAGDQVILSDMSNWDAFDRIRLQ
ncbi:MAG TPA: efflux RND transporter periplasmic adaptor subunit [Vicinamibacterales bacterium]|nr:efflux RND transporter periplasmic adaptor subunit [Vicinamibacterales bacterium]